MLDQAIIQLESPLVDTAIFVTAIATALCVRALRKGVSIPGVMQTAFATLRSKAGSAELAQQGLSRTISMITAAAAVFIVGYGILQQARTEICAHNLTQIASAEDLRFDRGYGYTANGAVTAAAFVDSDGDNDYLKVTPLDPAASKTAQYAFAATQTNGDWTYTITDPTTASHAAWTTLAGWIQGATTSTTNLEYIGPDGAVQAH